MDAVLKVVRTSHEVTVWFGTNDVRDLRTDKTKFPAIVTRYSVFTDGSTQVNRSRKSLKESTLARKVRDIQRGWGSREAESWVEITNEEG